MSFLAPSSRPPRRRALATAALAGAAAATAARGAYAAATRAQLRRNVAALMDGDPEPLLRFYRPDAAMVFPGESSWGGTYRGRTEIEGFLRRFHAAGLRGELGAVLVDGPPWATRIALEFADWAHDDSGAKIYDNRAVIVLRARWGRVVAEEVYEDTQKVAAFDERLAATPATGTRTAGA